MSRDKKLKEAIMLLESIGGSHEYFLLTKNKDTSELNLAARSTPYGLTDMLFAVISQDPKIAKSVQDALNNYYMSKKEAQC